MKKLLLLIFVLCLFKVSFSQTYPSKQIIGTTQTLVVDTGGMRIKGVFMLGHFVDTVAANAVLYVKNYPYGLITTDTNSVWLRSYDAKKWLQIFLSGSSSDTLTWKLGGNDFTDLSGYATLGSISNDPIYFMTNNLKRLGIPETGILRSASAFNKCLTFDTATKLMYYGDCSGGGGGGGFGRIGLIDSLGHFSNGASTDGNSLFMQTATESSPGLLSAEDKAKIDSLNNIYWYAVTKTGYLSTGYRPNDSTMYSKALLLSMPAEFTVTPVTTDTTGAWNVTWSGAAGGGPYWGLTGNSGTTPGTNFIGTTDAAGFQIKTNNTRRIDILSSGEIGLGIDASAGIPIYGYTSGSGSGTTMTKYINSNGNSIFQVTSDGTTYLGNYTTGTSTNNLSGINKMPNMASGVGTKVVRINPADGTLTYADTTTGGGGGSGTVTSVATGYGLSGGTITTAGTLLLDSATLYLTGLRRKDSLTSTNLLGYITKTVLGDSTAAIRTSIPKGLDDVLALNQKLTANRTVDAGRKTLTIDSLNSLTLRSLTTDVNEGAYMFQINRGSEAAIVQYSDPVKSSKLEIGWDDSLNAYAYMEARIGGAPTAAVIVESYDSSMSISGSKLHIFTDSLVSTGGINIQELKTAPNTTNKQAMLRDSVTGQIYRYPLNTTTVTPAALTKTDDTNVTLTLGGTPTTALLQATSLTLGWTGTLADGRIASAATWNAKQDALSGTGYSKWSGSTPSYLTPTQVTADLNTFTSSLQGLVPASGGSARKVLHADGNWYDTTAFVSNTDSLFGLQDNAATADRVFAASIYSFNISGAGNSSTKLGVSATSAGDSSTSIGKNAQAISNTSLSIGNLAGYGATNNAVSVGFKSGYNNTGTAGTFIGSSSGSGNTGNSNVFIGSSSGLSNSGATSTAVGVLSANANSAANLTAFGYESGKTNSGTFVTAAGRGSARTNTGNLLTAFGYDAGNSNSADSNVFIGNGSGYANTGKRNAFVGIYSGYNNTGARNAGIGDSALAGNTYNSTIGLGFKVIPTSNNQFIVSDSIFRMKAKGMGRNVVGYVLTDSTGNGDMVLQAAGGSMTYPGAGIANSTGSAWGTSYTTTGSGTVLALATSPTFVTPVLGTPTSVTLTNATGLPEGGLSLTDITTANTSTSAHGFFPKLTSNSVYYVNNSGALTALTVGASGTVLTGNGVTSAPTWAAPSTVATAMPFNGLTAATGTNSIDNTSYAQSWDWSTISNGTALNIKSNGIGSSGTLLKLSTTVAGTMTGTTSSLLNIDATGATGSTPTPTGIIININATSGSALNTGMKVSAYGGGGPNYAAKFLRGVVGLGTAGTETGVLEFNGSTSGTVGLQSAVAAGTWTMTLPTTGGTSGYFLQTNGSGVTTWAAPTGSTTSTLAYVAKTANYTITTSDYLVNCTSGTFTITLPTAASITGQSFQVKNSGTGVITINTTSSQTVDGYASGTLTISQYQSLTFMSDGSNWILL